MMGALGIRRFGSARRAIGLVAAGVVAVGLTACEPLPTDGRDLGIYPDSPWMQVRTEGTMWTEVKVTNNGTETATGAKLLVAAPSDLTVDMPDLTCDEHPDESQVLWVCALRNLAPQESDWQDIEVTGGGEAGATQIQVGVLSDLHDAGPSPRHAAIDVAVAGPTLTFTGQEEGPFVTGEIFELTLTAPELVEVEYLQSRISSNLEVLSIGTAEGEWECRTFPAEHGCLHEVPTFIGPGSELIFTFQVVSAGSDGSVDVTAWSAHGTAAEAPWGTVTVGTMIE